MTVRTADNQTVGCEVLLQLREKPLASCETTNEKHKLHEKKLAIHWQVIENEDDIQKFPCSMLSVVPRWTGLCTVWRARRKKQRRT
jgi:hypothetical protein